MTKSIQQNEAHYRSIVSFKRYSTLDCCFAARFRGFIPDNFDVQFAPMPSSAMRNFDWNRPNNIVNVIGPSSRIVRLHYGFQAESFGNQRWLRRSEFPPQIVFHDKLKALDPGFIENTDDYTKRIFACESFSI